MPFQLDRKALKSRSRMLLFSVVCTFLSLAPTAYAALVSNSTVLLADLLRCLAEFVAILLSWLVLVKMLREDRSTFNYDFGKLEQLSNLAVAAALFFTFLISVTSSVQRFVNPVPVTGSWFGLVFAILSVLGNGFWWIRNWQYNRESPSPVIAAQANLIRAKTMATLVVTLALGIPVLFGEFSWTIYLDPIGTLILALFVLYSAYAMISASVPDLIDRAIEEELQFIVLKILIAHEGSYQGLEAIRSRRSGGKIYIDLFLQFTDMTNVLQIRNLAALISSELKKSLPNSETTIVPT